MLIVDGDLYLYRCTAATEEETDWGDDIWSLTTDLKIAKDLFTKTLDGFKETLGDDDVVICLSSSFNFRKALDPNYKGHRKKTRKPLGFVAMLDWVQHHHRCFQKQGLEADDCLGILATMPENEGKGIIVSRRQGHEDHPWQALQADYQRVSGDQQGPRRLAFLHAVPGR